MQPMHNYLWSQYRDSETEYFRRSKVYVEKGLRSVEKILERTSGKFCIGDEITIADVFLCPELYRAIEYGIDLGQFPYSKKIWETTMKVAAFYSTQPNNEPDCPTK